LSAGAVTPGATRSIGGFERSLPMALMRAREAVMARFRPILAEHGLTEQQWRVLRALDDHDRPMSVGALAERTCLLGPSVSRMLAAMERRELIERRLDRGDARRTEVAIASAGREVVARIGPRSEAVYGEIETALGADDLASLHGLLDRLAGFAG
jgi:homoprotocatechuate degradation regulator HpaR